MAGALPISIDGEASVQSHERLCRFTLSLNALLLPSVKSLVREFDSAETLQQPSSGESSLAGSPSTRTLQSKSSMSSLTPEYGHAHARKTSIASSSSSSITSAGTSANARKLDYGSTTSSTSINNALSGLAAIGGTTDSSRSSRPAPARYPSDVSSNGGGGPGLDTSALEELEESDVFLPMSPFTPGYSMSGNGSAGNSIPNSPARRETGSSTSSRPNNGPPPTMTAAERREHSRRNSNIHARNLSVFFPRPEQQGQAGYQNRADEVDEDQDQVVLDIPNAETRGWGFASNNNAYKPRDEQTGLGGSSSSSQANTRRGHHHRHSMSHNFFPFIDTTQSPRRTSNSSLSPHQHRIGLPVSPGAGSSGSSLQVPDSATSPSTPRPVPALSSSTSRHRHTSSDPSIIPSISLRSKYSHLPSPVRLLLAVVFHLPLLTQVSLVTAIAEIGLGASLWVARTTGESLAVTGLGYLVVFDGLAALSSIMVEGTARGTDRLWDVMQGRRAGDNGVRYPFG